MPQFCFSGIISEGGYYIRAGEYNYRDAHPRIPLNSVVVMASGAHAELDKDRIIVYKATSKLFADFSCLPHPFRPESARTLSAAF